MEPEFGIHQIWYLFHNLGRRYEYGLAAWQFCLFVACLACFLSCEREMIRLDRNLRKRNKKKEDDGTESFLPSHPATKAQWTKGCGRGILSLFPGTILGGLGKGDPLCCTLQREHFHFVPFCSWHKKEVNLHYPFQKKNPYSPDQTERHGMAD